MQEKLQGIIALHKPAKMTSHDCVARIRKLFKTKKVGHTGTLDPEVTGVLPICIGRATKIAQYMSDYGKEYIGEVTLGISTETEDAYGAIIKKESLNRSIEREEAIHALKGLTGRIEQIPPMYSAVKVAGKKLYEYARAGIEVERPKRTVNIEELELLSDIQTFDGEFPSFQFRVKCSKGTYVRTLAVMIGEAFGVPAHMSYLVRTKSGPFSLKESVTFEQLEEAIESGNEREMLFPLEKGIAHFPKWVVNEETEKRVKNGSVLDRPKEMEVSPFAVYNREGICLALYEFHPSKPGLIKPEKIIAID